MGVLDAIGGGIFGSGGMINSFLHPEEGYKAAQAPINQAWNEASGYYGNANNQVNNSQNDINSAWNSAEQYGKPYWEQGVGQGGRLNAAENALLDPEALYNKWAQGYQTSPYAKQELEANKNAGLDAASSMGLMGSSAAINNIQTGAGNIVNQDRQNYLNDLMKKYMEGIGIGQNIYGTGANMGASLGGNAMQRGQLGVQRAGLSAQLAADMARAAQQRGEQQAFLKYNETNAPGQTFANILGTGANLASKFLMG